MTTPREAFDRMRQHWLTNTATYDEDQLAADVVLEMPFAAPGRPTRVEGRSEVLAFTRAGQAALPIRFEDCRNIVVHDTTDPETIIVEYELAATLTTTGASASAPFIGILRVRDGRIVHWREYQNSLAIMHALGQLTL
jgi:ketosteroid isomerase-like protein